MGTRAAVPVLFFTHVRKVEPMGSDCIRIYCSVVQDGAWNDKCIIEMPIVGAMDSSEFVTKAATEFFSDRETPLPRERAATH